MSAHEMRVDHLHGNDTVEESSDDSGEGTPPRFFNNEEHNDNRYKVEHNCHQTARK